MKKHGKRFRTLASAYDTESLYDTATAVQIVKLARDGALFEIEAIAVVPVD